MRMTITMASRSNQSSRNKPKQAKEQRIHESVSAHECSLPLKTCMSDLLLIHYLTGKHYFFGSALAIKAS